MRKTRVRNHLRRTRRKVARVRRHNRRLRKNRGARFKMFNPKKDKEENLVMDELSYAVRYEEPYNPFFSQGEWSGTDEAIALDEHGNVIEVNPVIIQQRKEYVGDMKLVPTNKGVRAGKYSKVITKVTEPKFNQVSIEKAVFSPTGQILVDRLDKRKMSEPKKFRIFNKEGDRKNRGSRAEKAEFKQLLQEYSTSDLRNFLKRGYLKTHKDAIQEVIEEKEGDFS